MLRKPLYIDFKYPPMKLGEGNGSTRACLPVHKAVRHEHYPRCIGPQHAGPCNTFKLFLSPWTSLYTPSDADAEWILKHVQLVSGQYAFHCCYCPQQSFGKVIFLHLSVILFIWGYLSRRGISVQERCLCRGVGFSVQEGGLCPGGLCPWGSLSRVFLSREVLSRRLPNW